MASALTSRVLECPVCHEEFRSPKILPCGHTFCLEPCLQQLGHGKSAISCPECREQHDLPSGGVSGFPNNVFIVRLLEKPKKCTNDTICPICSTTSFSLLQCRHCRDSVCERCRNEHTAEMKDELLTLCDALQKNSHAKTLNSEYIKWQESRTQIMSDFLAKLDETSSNLIRAVQERTREIRQSYEEVWNENDVGQIKTRLADVRSRVERAKTQDELVATENDILTYKDKLDEHQPTSVPDVITELDCRQLLDDIRTFGDIYVNAKLGDVPDPEPDAESQTIAVPKPLQPPPQIPVQSVLDREIDVRSVYTGEFFGYNDIKVSPATGRIVLTGGNGVRICTEELKTIKEQRLPSDVGTYLDTVVNSEGEIFVLTTSTICTFYEASDKQTSDKPTGFRHGQTLALDCNDKLHICCRHNGVVVLDRHLSKITTYGNGHGIYPEKITVSGDRMYVTNVRGHDVRYDCKLLVFNNKYQLMNSIDIGKRYNSNQMRNDPFLNQYGLLGKMTMIKDKYVMVGDPQNGDICVLDGDWKIKKRISTKTLGLLPPTAISATQSSEILLLYNDKLYYLH